GLARFLNQDIDSAQCSNRRTRDGLDRIGILYIAAESERLNSQLLQFLRRLFAAFLFPRAEHQVCAHFRQAFGHLASQSRPAAADNRDASAQIEKLFYIHRLSGSFQAPSFSRDQRGVKTILPTIRPARNSSRTSFTCTSGRVATWQRILPAAAIARTLRKSSRVPTADARICASLAAITIGGKQRSSAGK